MATSTIPNPNGLVIGNVTGTIMKKHAANTRIYAPTKTGYRFLCWFYIATEGWVSNIYPATPANSITDIYVADMGLNYDTYGDFMAYCLYVPD